MSAEQEKAEDKFSVFLSYSSADQELADKVRHYLVSYLDARVFTQDSLSIGERWEDRLRDEISSSKIFVVILSPHSLGSSWMRWELGAAWGLEKPVLSVCAEPSFSAKLPVELENVKYVGPKDFDNPTALNKKIWYLLNYKKRDFKKREKGRRGESGGHRD